MHLVGQAINPESLQPLSTTQQPVVDPVAASVATAPTVGNTSKTLGFAQLMDEQTVSTEGEVDGVVVVEEPLNPLLLTPNSVSDSFSREMVQSGNVSPQEGQQLPVLSLEAETGAQSSHLQRTSEVMGAQQEELAPLFNNSPSTNNSEKEALVATEISPQLYPSTEPSLISPNRNETGTQVLSNQAQSVATSQTTAVVDHQPLNPLVSNITSSNPLEPAIPASAPLLNEQEAIRLQMAMDTARRGSVLTRESTVAGSEVVQKTMPGLIADTQIQTSYENASHQKPELSTTMAGDVRFDSFIKTAKVVVKASGMEQSIDTSQDGLASLVKETEVVAAKKGLELNIGNNQGRLDALVNAAAITQPRMDATLNHQTSLLTVAPTATETPQIPLNVGVGKPGWGEAIVQRVMWMSSQQLQTAEIALDPPELGSLQVKVSTVQDQTSISFTSPHGVVREVLEQNMSRLREMMDNEGLQLADVDVSGHSKSRGEGSEAQADGESLSQDDESLLSAEQQAEAGQSTLAEHSASLALVDAYV